LAYFDYFIDREADRVFGGWKGRIRTDNKLKPLADSFAISRDAHHRVTLDDTDCIAFVDGCGGWVSVLSSQFIHSSYFIKMLKIYYSEYISINLNPYWSLG